MIHLFVPPTCSCCGTNFAAMYSCDLWEGFYFCRACQQTLVVWLLKNQLADENPLAEALLATDSESDFYYCWHPSLSGGANVFSEAKIKRVSKIPKEKD